MMSSLKSSDFKSPSPLVGICLKCETPSIRTSLIATNPNFLHQLLTIQILKILQQPEQRKLLIPLTRDEILDQQNCKFCWYLQWWRWINMKLFKTSNGKSTPPELFFRKKVFWKDAANLQENTHAEVRI